MVTLKSRIPVKMVFVWSFEFFDVIIISADKFVTHRVGTLNINHFVNENVFF